MLEEYKLQVEQGFVYGRFYGEVSDPLVLGIHGLSKRNGWHTWQSLLEPLGGDGFLALSIDMPGWGQSTTWGEEPLKVDDAIECICLIADDLKKDKIVLMGKSWGGAIAIQAALDQPELIAGLILTAPAFLQFEQLSDIKQPVLLVWAQDDPVLPVYFANKFQNLLRNSALIIYDSGGHNAAPANSSDFAPKAVEFLRSISEFSER